MTIQLKYGLKLGSKILHSLYWFQISGLNLSGSGFGLDTITGQAIFVNYDTLGSNQWDFLQSGPNLLDNICHHGVAVVNSDSLHLYVDGIHESAVVATFQSIPSNAPLSIGKFNLNSLNHYKGSINQIRIWNDGRTPSEITTYMDSSFVGSTDASLAAFYEFDGAVGQTTLNDQRAGGTIHGALTNMDENTDWVNDDCVDSNGTGGTVGLDEIPGMESTISAYPNPTDGTVNIQLGGLTDAIIHVYTMNGQLVYTRSNVNTEKHTFNLEGESGIYHVVVTANNTQKHLKLVKL